MSGRSLADRLAAHGFAPRAEGRRLGYVRTASDGFEEVILADSEYMDDLPRRSTARVVVGDCPNGWTGSTEPDQEWHADYTLGECLAALDNPIDEYALLTMRLQNNLQQAPRPAARPNPDAAGQTIKARLRACGFRLERTGGESTAYTRISFDGEVVERIVEAVDGFSVPTRLTDQVLVVTTYTSEIEAGITDGSEPEAVTKGYTLGDVLRALENPNSEWSEVSWRLWANLHKADG